MADYYLLETDHHFSFITNILDSWSSESLLLVASDGVLVRCPRMVMTMYSSVVRTVLAEERRTEEVIFSVPVSSKALLHLTKLLQTGDVIIGRVEDSQGVAEAADLLGVDVGQMYIVDEKPKVELIDVQKTNIKPSRRNTAVEKKNQPQRAPGPGTQKENSNPKIFTEGSDKDPSLAERYQCAECDSSFFRKDKLVTHVKSKHTPGGRQRAVVCSLCAKILSRPDKLKDHIRRRHTGAF